MLIIAQFCTGNATFVPRAARQHLQPAYARVLGLRASSGVAVGMGMDVPSSLCQTTASVVQVHTREGGL